MTTSDPTPRPAGAPGALGWYTIEGLTPVEREAGQHAFPRMNLLVVAITHSVVDGVALPDIIYGVVRRKPQPARQLPSSLEDIAPPAAGMSRGRLVLAAVAVPLK
ncbi:hypothetical protein ACO03V_15560 [Microbacterium sp. HMH0099]|uniref:hypothetical protein n=1 Tax=Microbacterium sp. HMH0099 TaxID=3414026 RepID=UPI003BF66752